jgi:hypothetical protein
MVRHFEEAPPILNLFEPALPTKRELLARLRRDNPDLTVLWLPPVVLVPLSWFAIALQKAIRPRTPAIDVAKIFARLRYDTSLIAGLAPAIRAYTQRTATREWESVLTSVRDPGDITSPASRDRQLAEAR